MASTWILLISFMILVASSTSQTVLTNILEHQTPVNISLGQTVINGAVTPLAMTIDSIRVANGGSTLFNVSVQLKMLLGDAVLPTRLDTVLGTPPANTFPTTSGSLIPLILYITVANSTIPIHLDVNLASFIQNVANNLLQSPTTLISALGNGASAGLAALIPPPFWQPPQSPPQNPLSGLGRNSFTGFPMIPNLSPPRNRSTKK